MAMPAYDSTEIVDHGRQLTTWLWQHGRNTTNHDNASSQLPRHTTGSSRGGHQSHLRPAQGGITRAIDGVGEEGG